jgi:GT2 family glycosyltransferase
MVDFTMEDVAFCFRIREKGIHVLIDPQVKVGHEKSMVF